MYNLFTANGGLYIKIGYVFLVSTFSKVYLTTWNSQAIGANAAFLPKPMQLKFAKLFDDAPQIPYSTVEQVFRSELGRPPCGPGGVFEIFEEEAIASASIAQVHKAKLWPVEGDDSDRWVAVKVQKPDVATQMVWDLGAYRAVMWMFEHWAFDLPVYFVVGECDLPINLSCFQSSFRLHFGPPPERARFRRRGKQCTEDVRVRQGGTKAGRQRIYP
jgi:aarF domain-containing kinase